MGLSAIMPLCARGSYDIDDLSRSEILFKSLTAFSDGLFDKFLVVVPDNEVDLVTDFYGTKWRHLNVEVVSELVLVPELARHNTMRGWRKQQIIKLAAPRMLPSDFFITFDADVICLKPITEEQLVVKGRALMQYESRDLHPKWWRSSAKILKMSTDVGEPDVGMSITPAIMSRFLTQSLTQELEKIEKENWVDALGSLHQPKNPRNWRLSRYLKNKWTEYSLYYLNALKQGEFENYHTIAGTKANPQLLMIHDSHPFETWNVENSFSPTCPGLFCVVGSKSMLPPSVVWDKVSPYIDLESTLSLAS